MGYKILLTPQNYNLKVFDEKDQFYVGFTAPHGVAL